jgi:hypothetical protein
MTSTRQGSSEQNLNIKSFSSVLRLTARIFSRLRFARPKRFEIWSSLVLLLTLGTPSNVGMNGHVVDYICIGRN